MESLLPLLMQGEQKAGSGACDRVTLSPARQAVTRQARSGPVGLDPFRLRADVGFPVAVESEAPQVARSRVTVRQLHAHDAVEEHGARSRLMAVIDVEVATRGQVADDEAGVDLLGVVAEGHLRPVARGGAALPGEHDRLDASVHEAPSHHVHLVDGALGSPLDRERRRVPLHRLRHPARLRRASGGDHEAHENGTQHSHSLLGVHHYHQILCT